MKTKKQNLFVSLCLAWMLGTGGAVAQTDVTDGYLLNPGFDSEYDYDKTATGNVAQEMLSVAGWTNDYTMDYTIVGIYELGTAKTFNGASVPATDADGAANGGVLALSTGWNEKLKLYQEVALPAGKYGLATAYYNGCSATAATSLLGWIPTDGTAVLSTVQKFPANAWTLDTVFFEIKEAEVTGRIQLGMQAAANGSANSAKLSIDYVKLLYYGVDKNLLVEVLAEAQTLYGDGTGTGSDALKALMDAATTVIDNDAATDKEVVTAMDNLKKGMETFRYANASTENPIDFTAHITNPSFEDGTNGWVQSGMQTQTNTSFAPKSGSTYVEKWTATPGPVGDCYIHQTVSGLANGRYLLKAAAQHLLQANLNKAQSGACIYAGEDRTTVTKAGQYEVSTTVISGSLTIGFKVEGATGNWVAVDNFRLYYIGDAADAQREALQQAVTEAQALAALRMHTGAQAALQTAIATAQAELAKGSVEGFAEAATALDAAIEAAQASADAYAALLTTLTEAQTLLGDGSQEGAASLSGAIATAQQVYDGDATVEELQAAAKVLDEAAFALRIANATGTVPTVTTHPYVARGATMAFGRSTVTGVSSSNLLETGYCWSTQPEPTVLDNRTTEYLTNSGKIYWMKGLTPATVYYVRAYALTKEYAVGYGEAVKVITIPKGRMTWSYNEGAPDADANTRIREAVADAVDNYLNQLTSISGFHTTVNYGASTPTADCSYGGWMRVGPNASYQRTGTILHELGHGIGVGTHEIWYGPSSPLRANGSSGTWLGDRVTAVVRFLDNNTTGVLSGDGTHMWPYGVNGAHEDTGNPFLYIGNALITQALGEDGLPPTGGFCTPAYVLEQSDDVKYYIKNEDPDRGLYSAYLTVNERGNLVWSDKSAADATANDSCAWYITFTPDNAYYQLRNAATGRYITYASAGTNGIKTAERTTPTSAEDFHLMRSRTDAVVGEGTDAVTTRGYWLIHPEAKLNPACLSASANGATATAAFDLSDAATTQRWLILTADELAPLESASQKAYREQVDEMTARLQALLETPHVEEAEGTDAALQAIIAKLQADGTGSSITQTAALLAEAEAACITFLSNATPSDVAQPFDITFYLENAAIDDATGWSVAPTVNHSCAEFFQQSFDYYQTLSGMPAGTYQLRAQAFQRPGDATTAYQNYIAGTNGVTTRLYIGTKSEKVQHIAACAQQKHLGGSESTVATGTYVPNDMLAASKYFAAGLYDNAVTGSLTVKGNLKAGIRCSSTTSSYWTCFDNFRLYYFGSLTADEVADDIDEVTLRPEALPLFAVPTDIYSIVGVCVRRQATGLDGLPAGLYIVGGRKVLVK